MKKKLASFAMLFVIVSAVFAGGRKDIEEKSLGAKNSWQESLDVNNKSAGKYNVVVTAEDKAGNTTSAGPFNIWLDPDSDLPVVGITNPVEGMRVPGNLNIVGTCIDDDAVDHVSLILDGNYDDIKTATGKDFWAYYLDTNNLHEGPHTIEVFGTDVNGLNGNHVFLTWQLDRRTPVTEVRNYNMGEIVAGKISLEGASLDGNGIRQLEYSLDGGKHYSLAKIKEVKLREPDSEGRTSEFYFSIPVDTTKFPDGPATCWFKATDCSGSVGRFAYLFFIDNTKPDVRIVSPADGEVKNGVFTVAGYAKDVIGIEKLSWQWGEQTGDFTLIPGNPYWVIEVDSRGKIKSEVFSVTAVDIMGNSVTMKRNIPLNQEADKPVVTIKSPEQNLLVNGNEEKFFLRGIAKDDDGVVSITWSLDGGEESTVNTSGVFYAEIPGHLDFGIHTLSVYATDRFGLNGDASVVQFVSTGSKPYYENDAFERGGESVEFTDGMELHPEADGSYAVTVNAPGGLSTLSWELVWGSNGSTTGKNSYNGEKSTRFTLPLSGEEIPWGISELTIYAKDLYGRTGKHAVLLNITDLSRQHGGELGVRFDDSTIGENGGILYTAATEPVTGYFNGGAISSVTVVPAVRNVSVRYEENVIIVTPSAPTSRFRVQVTSDTGATYTSKELYFYAPETAPTITLNESPYFNTAEGKAFDFNPVENAETPVPSSMTVSGHVTGDNVSVNYRILSVDAKLPIFAGGLMTSVESPKIGEYKNVSVNRNGDFSLPAMSVKDFGYGYYVVEITAGTPSGLKDSTAVFVRNIPPAFEDTVIDGLGRTITKLPPQLRWITGEDYYGVALYQGSLDRSFEYVKAKDITVAQESIAFSVVDVNGAPDRKGEKPTFTSENLPVKASSIIEGRFTTIDGRTYMSGMNIPLKRSSALPDPLHLSISTNAPITSVSYEFVGEEGFGGDNNSRGTATLTTLADAESYEALIPVQNLPARMTDVIATITDVRGNTKKVNGTINIVRPHAIVDSLKKVYWMELDGSRYSDSLSAYVLDDGASLVAYGNFRAPLTASLRNPVAGLSVTTEGNVVKLTGTQDGVYRGVAVRVTSADGGTYNAPEVNLVVDTGKPDVKITSPLEMSWVGESLLLSGSVSDGNGISRLEYTLEDEHTKAPPATKAKKGAKNASADTNSIPTVYENEEPEWKTLNFTRSGNFNERIDLRDLSDGYVSVNIRATDTTGKVTLVHSAAHKDTTSPNVSVIVPDVDAVVNGEITMVFSVEDDGRMDTISYTSANGRKTSTFNYLQNLVDADFTESPDAKTLNQKLPNINVGREDFPLEQGMNFEFTDAAGNKTQMKNWLFTVDEESNKPRTEIHVPEENQVITTDFVISGIVYDDDGACLVYYSIDDGPFNLVSEDRASSYKINVPLAAMTDNEHKVTMYAIDINGVRGDTTVRNFRISLEEPKGSVEEPDLSQTVKGSVTLKGWATDENGISKVEISIDNGASYNEAELTPTAEKNRSLWSYTFDTRVIQDGTHVVFLRIWDGYKIEGLFSYLINVDNTAPDLRLELPLDDSKTSQNLFFAGQTTDNIGLTQLYITITSLENKKISAKLAHMDLIPSEIIAQAIDISDLDNGFYNIELSGVDAAGNITRVSRNIQLDKKRPLIGADLLYPLNGEHLQGDFNIYGVTTAEHDDPIDVVQLYLDGLKLDILPPVKITSSGYFKFRLSSMIKMGTVTVKQEDGTEVSVPAREFELTPGHHTYQVVATTMAGNTVSSNVQSFEYSPYGPWVTLDNFDYGDFAVERPLLRGNAGYSMSPEHKAVLKDKDAPSEDKTYVEGMKVHQVMLSLDNGKTYFPVSKLNKGSWQYRIENLDIAPGYHFLLVKAEMQNGEVAITRTIVQVDRENPSIRLIAPGEGGRYNQQLTFSGLASDDVDLKNVQLTLRTGDKNSYGVPGFIQGMYLDTNFWGASLFSVGMGLTFFDDVVKVQMSWGQFTQTQRDFVNDILGQPHKPLRFGGDILSAKIIAQVYQLPFRVFLGRDWDWLSATFSVGANFSYFTESGASRYSEESVPQLLSAAFLQIEFPRMYFKNNTFAKTWAVYTEPQVWFIPSDIAGVDPVLFSVSLGLRSSVF